MKRTLVILSVAVIIAYLLVMLGSSDWLGRMSAWPFYKDWIITTVSAFIVLVYFDRVHRWLDEGYPWFEHSRRLWLQALLLVLVPLGMAILITYLQYEFIYDQGLITHGYFQNEFLMILLVVGVVNLCYFILYLLRRNRQVEAQHSSRQDISVSNGSAPAKDVIVIGQRGGQRVPVQERDIAVIWLESRVVFLKTFDGDKLILSDNLDKYEQELSEADFFRANRQMILNRKACASFESIENGKVRVDLLSTLGKSVTVSQKKAARFREWIKD